MLVDLLNHQEELFLGVIEQLVYRRDFRSICAILAANKQLFKFISSLEAYYEIMHRRFILPSLKIIKSMHRLSNHYSDLVEYNNTLRIYKYSWNDNIDEEDVCTGSDFSYISLRDKKYYIQSSYLGKVKTHETGRKTGQWNSLQILADPSEHYWLQKYDTGGKWIILIKDDNKDRYFNQDGYLFNYLSDHCEFTLKTMPRIFL